MLCLERKMLKIVLKFAALILATYMLSWTCMYFWIMGADASYFTKYLKLSWQGPGEIPALIQAVALFATGLVTVACAGIRRLRK
jgi:hypothetical protein